jgi:RNA polymerase primary sigma factor
MIAAAGGHFDCARLLLEAGCDPEAVDHSGLDTLSHAAASGRADVTELVAARLPEVSDANEIVGASATPERDGGDSRLSQRDIVSPDVFDWVEEVAPTVPAQDDSLVSSLAGLQGDLSRHGAHADGVDWDEVQLSLPAPSGSARAIEIPPATATALKRLLGPAAELGAMAISAEIGSTVGLTASGTGLLKRVATDAGIIVYASTDPWLSALEGKVASAEPANDLVEEFALRLHARRAPSPYDTQLDRVPPLDRDQEDGLWTAADRSLDEALQQIAASPAALQRVLAAEDLIRRGVLTANFVTALQDDIQPADQEDSLEEEDGEETQPCFEVQIPQSIAAAFDGLRVEVKVGGSGDDPHQIRRCGAALRGCLLKLDFIEGIAAELFRQGSTDLAADLSTRCRNVRRLRRRIVELHLPHVNRVAARYLGRGLELDDLVQEGSLGLLTAVERFDRGRGLRFWTYAIWWVRQSITRAVADKSRGIRLPVYRFESLMKIERQKELFEQENGRSPSPLELCRLLELPLHIVQRLLDACGEMVSLEAADDDANDSLLRGASSIIEGPNPEQKAAESQLKDVLTGMLRQFDPRVERVLRMRFGIDLERDHTLEEVGQAFSVTRERIRQLEAKALKKMAHPARGQVLSSLLEA